MTTGLFRSQVIEHRKQGLHGDVLLLPRLSHTLCLFALILWFIFLLSWLFTSHYARKETVLGWLEPPQGVIRIYAGNAGLVQQILVHEGDHVEKDQPLLVIHDEQTLSNGQNLNLNLLEEYQLQQQFMDEQLARAQPVYEMRQKDIASRLSSAKKDLTLINEQLAITNNRYELIKAQIARYRTLKKDGYASTAELDNILAQELTLKNEQKNLLRNQISQSNTIEKLETEQNLLPTENANQVSELRSRISNIKQKITQLQGRSSRIIKAPRAGTVNNLQAREGQQTATTGNIPLLTLFPDDSSLTAHLLIPVRSIGFIEEGQSLIIRYDAFPYQKFGINEGTILKTSKTVLLPNELLNVPVATKEPVYQISAQLKRPTINAYGKDFPLKPGMTLSADVNLGNRTLVEWLLEPIYSLKGRI